jgi:hypothetical protein
MCEKASRGIVRYTLMGQKTMQLTDCKRGDGMEAFVPAILAQGNHPRLTLAWQQQQLHM